MFFNVYLSFFNNKGNYKIVPHKFFSRFFPCPHTISRQKGKKVTHNDKKNEVANRC